MYAYFADHCMPTNAASAEVAMRKAAGLKRASFYAGAVYFGPSVDRMIAFVNLNIG